MKGIVIHKGRYRGYEIGHIRTLKGFRPVWRSSFEAKWIVCGLYVNDIDSVEITAKENIDFRYAEEAESISLGRQLTIDDLHRLYDEMKER